MVRQSKVAMFIVDWEANMLAMKSASINRRHHVTTVEYGMCGTRKMKNI